jgi:hypothetical protein
MRAKVILPVSVLAFVVVASAVYFHFKVSEPAPAAEPVASDASDAVAPAATPKILQRVSSQARAHDGVPVEQDDAADLKAANHDEYVQERNVQLYQLGMSQNPAALPTILAELHNSDPAIRSTALTATMEIGSKDAIPALRNEMSWTEDLQEKLEIQKAIDFLQLPPFAMDEHGAFVQQTDGQSSSAR